MSFTYKLKLIAAHYGLAHQLRKTQEELRELDEAIEEHKIFHNPFTRAHIAEEIADVLVTCLQIMGLMGIDTSEVLARARFKANRQLWRIEEGKKKLRAE